MSSTTNVCRSRNGYNTTSLLSAMPTDNNRSKSIGELARDYYKCIDRNEYEKIFDLFSEDIVYQRPGQPTIIGIDDLRRFYLEERPLSTGEHEIDSIVVDNQIVAVRGQFSGTQNGSPTIFGWADFHQFEDGVITVRHTYTDRDEI